MLVAIAKGDNVTKVSVVKRYNHLMFFKLIAFSYCNYLIKYHVFT